MIPNDPEIYPEILYSGRKGHDVYKQLYPDGQPTRLTHGPSCKLRDHSPTGFSWGYGGSGPAQLALALLYHATTDPNLALNYYQQFKWEHVNSWINEWQIFRSEILNWLQKAQAEDLLAAQGRN